MDTLFKLPMRGWCRCGSAPDEETYVNKYNGLLSSTPQTQQTYYEMVCSKVRSNGENINLDSLLSISFYNVMFVSAFISFPFWVSLPVISAIVLLFVIIVVVIVVYFAFDFANNWAASLRSRFCCRYNIWRCRCQSRSCALTTTFSFTS